ncbi:MAG: molybdopterin-dependent oxidoreductase [Candidatus Promineifilaceae bacterium]|nr:molybdopterin-dependent oxidoreductase [Candidatus Promineifilaceae bacterium]
MRKLSLGTGILVGGLLTAVLMGVLFLGQQLAGLPFVPYDLFNWIARELPGNLVTLGIDLMIDTMLLLNISVVDAAKTAERLQALFLFWAGGTFAGMVYFAVMKFRQARADILSGVIMGALFGLPLIAVSLVISQSNIHPLLQFLWLALLFLAWGVALSSTYARLERISQTAVTAAVGEEMDVRSVERIGRRKFLIRFGATTAVITVLSGGLGLALATAERRRREEALEDTMAHNSDAAEASSFPNANDPVVPVPGTRPEYTPIKDHYQVFLQTEPTVINGEEWMLPVTGLVDNPLLLTIDDIRDNYEKRDQYVTITCISGRVGTGLISTTQWSGASLQEVLADAMVQDSARYLIIESGDGFHETVDLELIATDERIMLCYEWDGNTLPIDHGYPLRIWIPDRYGMKQPKWITSMELVNEYVEGYWVSRNWDKEAIVKATSVIDTVAVDHIIENGGQTLVPIGGIAYAGARGISKVEVSVDGGPWEEAQLRSPLSETTWVIWRYEWPFTAGEHTFEVRCVEGDGTPQIEQQSDARPDGSSGIHSAEASL